MDRRSAAVLRDELHRLMTEQMESLQKQTFTWLDETELKQQEERLKRIREVSADFLAALQRGIEKSIEKEMSRGSTSSDDTGK
jgi:hypothetical protein